ncbi:MAG: hypothetical protein RI897_864 [Verrucomicrobiota bacterium]
MIWVVFEGFEDIGIGLGVLAEESAEDGDDDFEVGEVESSPGCAGGFTEVEDEEFALGFGDAVEFAEAACEVGKVTESVGDGDAVEGIIDEGEFQGISGNPGDGFGWGWGSVLGVAQHGEAEVDGDGGGAGFLEAQGDIAGSGADIERELMGLGCGLLDELVFPVAVEAEALDIVDEVVSFGDGGEEGAHLGGALGAGAVVRVAHVGAEVSWVWFVGQVGNGLFVTGSRQSGRGRR